MKNNKKNNIILMVMTVMMALVIMQLAAHQTQKVLPVKEFYNVVETKKVENTIIKPNNNVIDITGVYVENDRKIGFSTRLPNTPEQLNAVTKLLAEKDAAMLTADPNESNFFVDFLLVIIPYILLGGFMFFLFSKMGNGGNNKAFEFSKSRAKVQGDIKVRFKDVAGAEEEKEEMQELIEYLRHPKRFEAMGARIPKGMLLVGPPGTGKTLLAKAAAGEADVPFYAISGSDFVEMFVGVGASRVRDMFKKAKATAPCIIFIDEIDAVGRQRGAGMGGGHDEREQTLNQLLVEMDGIEENSGVLVLAATNRDDVLDPALLRPGRFDRTITVGLPDVKGRTEILQVHARNKKIADDVVLKHIARRTPGFSGADLENVLNEAAILSVRENKTEITIDIIDEAIDRVIMGPAKKSKKYTEKERYMVAVHETGHAIIGIKLKSADKVQKVTIIPRGQAGGYNLMTPREETFTQSRSDLMGKITGYLGGRVAEEIVFNEISTGAYSDIQSATKIARAMVTQYGMSDLGPIQYDSNDGNVFLGRDISQPQNYSGQIAFEIDKEVRHIIDQCKEEARKLIEENRELLDRIVEALLEYETITAEQIQNIVEGREANDNGVVDAEVVSETVQEPDTTIDKEI
ncbi:ATP-dependent zinc metalloprotease FtsH [Erysipelothrix enhydrae]|uniref:ATP-dependent zinc metalloprotease FtsH n=1 Tax=Erysipelothrix enhydrae TaxID=2890314 RepID=UPI002B247388|nr:ATP-dependent zinc metalloprotease FtsH [Erysipelothrix sp. 4322-04]WRB87513.1 ATP-dependent zinc metalloprotease FtsH [Erysipelothrix sp. 4322-04]